MSKPVLIGRGTVHTPIAIQAKVFDDGLPGHFPLHVQWTASGPGSVDFDDPNSERTSVTFDAVGSYALQLAATDGESSGADTISVIVAGSPSPNPGSANEAPPGTADLNLMPEASARKGPDTQMVVVGNEGVTWTNAVGVATGSGSLTKTAPNGWDAGAVSTKSIVSGDAYVEFTVGETNRDRMIGLGTGDLSQYFSDIDFAIYLPTNAPAEVHESGTSRGLFGAYATGDVFRVGIEGGSVKYRKNGVLIYTSATAPRYPLLVDTSLFGTGATVQGVVLSGTSPDRFREADGRMDERRRCQCNGRKPDEDRTQQLGRGSSVHPVDHLRRRLRGVHGRRDEQRSNDRIWARAT